MKVLVFLALTLSQFIVASQANENSNHNSACSMSEQTMDMADASYMHNHICENCVSSYIAVPNDTMRYFIFMNQSPIGLKFDFLYLSKISKVENPPPIFS